MNDKNMKKLLCIDNEITIRVLLEKYFKNRFDVTLFINGKEALTWLQQGNLPDLIVCDIEMPVMDGYEFLENVKASDYFADIPVIMLSAIEESGARIKCLKMGAKDFVVKPFNPEELELKIDIHLGDK